MPFTVLDIILVVIVLISAGLAMIRGFTREVFSIGSWVAAAAVTYFFWDDVRPYVQQYVEDENLSLGVTVAGIFFITLLVVSLITMRISDFVLDSRAGPLDRTLGFVFGAARGLILVVIAVLFLNFFIAPERQPEWIATALSKPWLDELGEGLRSRLPEDPEGMIERARGGSEEPATPPIEGAAPPPGQIEVTPTAETPDYAVEDQNELERQLEATPP